MGGARTGDGANDSPLVDTTPRGGAPGEYEFTPGTPFAFAPGCVVAMSDAMSAMSVVVVMGRRRMTDGPTRRRALPSTDVSRESAF